MATPTNATKITDHEKRVLAGIFARSNMGQGLPEPDFVQQALAQCTANWFSPQKKGDDFAIYFCQEFMETNEHERIFSSEAAMWFKSLGKRGENTREYITRVHPDIAKLVWPPAGTTISCKRRGCNVAKRIDGTQDHLCGQCGETI